MTSFSLKEKAPIRQVLLVAFNGINLQFKLFYELRFSLKHWILILIVLGIAISNPKSAHAYSKFPNQKGSEFTFGIGLQYLWAKADGSGRYTSNSIKGTSFKYDDLDLKDSRINIPVYDLYFGTRAHQLHFEFMQFTLEGSDRTNKPLTLDGTTYATGSSLSTDLETRWARAYYEFFDVRTNFSYGILLGVEQYKFSYDVLDNTTQTHNTFGMTTINPLLGMHVITGEGRFNLKLSAYYVPSLFGILDYKTLDLSAAAVFSFGNYVEIEGGYRFVNTIVNGDSNDDRNGIKLKGIFATFRIKF